MSVESKVSGHWTDEQLIAHLYVVGPQDLHVENCALCQGRLLALQSHRQAAEDLASSAGDVSFEFLTAQRRKIYGMLTEPVRWSAHLQLRRWASAAAGLLILGGGLLIFEQDRRPPAVPNNISDTQLAQEVGRMAENSEPPATAPLQALFEE
ncbi:MAG TPA: hypothetical protein VHU83_07645 [Bryobacteraceae bacterium]|jgi:hypothetical protein|nr:hypothetical protein [Bryobacteraceae bacterium]